MRLNLSRILLLGILLSLSFEHVMAQEGETDKRQRRGQAGMKFLSMSVDSRAAALGDAYTAISGSSTSLFYNPAGMAFIDGAAGVGLGLVNWIGDITYHTGSVAFQPAAGRYGVFGLSIQAVDYGEVISTIRADNEKGYLNVGTIEPGALSAGFGYARSLTDRFAIGGQVKYVRQSLGSSVLSYNGSFGDTEKHEKSAMAVDFGVLYRTGFRSLNFGVSVRNFAKELTYAQDSFELPLTMRIGFSMDMMDLMPERAGSHSLLLAVDAERSRDYSEQIRTGVEYVFRDVLSLRAGYAMPTDEQGINLGAGLQYPIQGMRVGVDYAYTDFGNFGNVNRIGINLTL